MADPLSDIRRRPGTFDILLCILGNKKSTQCITNETELNEKHVLQRHSYKVLNAVNNNLYIISDFNKNKNNWPLHCVSWINSNLQMAPIYLVFLSQ